MDLGAEDLGADQPAGLPRRLLLLVLLRQRPEDVGEALVQGSRLVLVDEPAGELDHAVGELVADHRERAGERREDHPVAVAVGHLLAVPESVVVVAAHVDARDHGEAVAVEGVAAVDLEVEPEDVAGALVRLGDLVVRGLLAALVEDQGARQRRLRLGVVDLAVGLGLLDRPRHHEAGRGGGRPGAAGLIGLALQGLDHLLLPGGAPHLDRVGHVGGKNAVHGMAALGVSHGNRLLWIGWMFAVYSSTEC